MFRTKSKKMAGDTSEGEPIIHLEAAAWNFVTAIEVYYLRKENSTTERMEVESVTVTPQQVAIQELTLLMQENSQRGKPHTADNAILQRALHALEHAPK